MSAWFTRMLSAGSVALILAVTTSTAHAQAPTSGWRMPNLNPFASKTNAPAAPGGRSTAAKVLDPFGLIPGTGGKTATASFGRQTQQPSTWQKMTTGTKRMASQTADFLNPFDDAQPQTRNENLTGSNSVFNQQANRRRNAGAQEKKSWLPGFGAPQPEEKPNSVNGFLAQPRPQP